MWVTRNRIGYITSMSYITRFGTGGDVFGPGASLITLLCWPHPLKSCSTLGASLPPLPSPLSPPALVSLSPTALQVLKCWRKVLDSQSRPQILASYGLHGLLLAGGVLLGKLARYSYYDALGTRLEAARMAATLLSAVFCGSIAHPQRNRDFATYVPVSLWDGADLFADPYRCNVQVRGGVGACWGLVGWQGRWWGVHRGVGRTICYGVGQTMF